MPPEAPWTAGRRRRREDMERARLAIYHLWRLGRRYLVQVPYSQVFEIIVGLGPSAMDWFVAEASELPPHVHRILLDIYPLY